MASQETGSSMAKVDTPRAVLNEIYESARVEIRPLDSDHQSWRAAEAVVRDCGRAGAVMTAWNPGLLRPTQEENELANLRMRRVLETLSADFWEADGFSPDGTFREPGFICWEMLPEQACAIAAKFGQYAIYYYTAEGHRRVIDCL